MRNTVLWSVTAIIMLSLISFRPLPDKWKEYKPSGGRCSVFGPGEPAYKEKIINSEVGELTMHFFSFQPAEGTDDNVLYAINYTDYPADHVHSDSAEFINSFFDHARDGAIKAVHGKLLTETILKYGKYPGREQRVDFKDGMAVIKFRYYLVKNRLYTLEVICLTDKDFNVSINKFMDSFKLAGE